MGDGGERIRFGDELERAYPLVRSIMVAAGQGTATYDWHDIDRCAECDAPKGDFHISGCDLEKCPRCGWQAIACWCT